MKKVEKKTPCEDSLADLPLDELLGDIDGQLGWLGDTIDDARERLSKIQISVVDGTPSRAETRRILRKLVSLDLDKVSFELETAFFNDDL